MKDFALDIWTDLREKRLWPVAVALLVGLVAVPVMLMKPAEEPDPVDTPSALAATPADTALATAKPLPAELEAVEPLLRTSTLSEFDNKDPFKPLRALETVEQLADVQSVSQAGAVDGGETPSSDGGGDGGSTGGTTPTTPVTPPADEEKTVFTYEAIVNFGTASGSRRRRLQRLGILPNARKPLLVFLGVSADDPEEAVFLVDSTVSQAGEGRCKPSFRTCSFLYLRTSNEQDEHIFTDDDGQEYTVQLLNVKRVAVRAPGESASANDDSAHLDGSPPVRPYGLAGGVEASFEEDGDDEEDAAPLFGFPLFADEVE